MESTTNEVWHRPFVKEHQQWCDDLVLELRLRDVPGPMIGDRLGEVEAHCAETGESPAEAFGDATQYARQLESGPPQRDTESCMTAVTSAGQALALLVGTAAVGPWARGEELSFNAVQLGALAVFVLVLLALPVLLGPLVRRPWSVGVPVLGLATLAAIGSAVGDRLDLPALLTLPPAAVTVGLFVVVLVIAVPKHRGLSRAVDDSRIPSPLAPASPESSARTVPHWAPLVLSYLVPAAYVLLGAVIWLTA
ncbi:hypothetical protein [Georgenia satyanarayanai]|uniref:hypothetical protein n=1 Tax=Georgenia satyanarayanai TaxID=860221 RepID=UPI001264593B|nr:hypothetical protein [Georgenia satyanarayanai]